jgi:hypothetical protein
MTQLPVTLSRFVEDWHIALAILLPGSVPLLIGSVVVTRRAYSGERHTARDGAIVLKDRCEVICSHGG